MSVTLAEALAAAAMDLAGVASRATEDDAIEYVGAGRPFAVLETGGLAASFHLETAVAAAAVRTPDVESSARGAGWVTIRPPVLDAHVIDRVNAWFESAWRLAGGA